jgi:hypothetical protein
MVVQMLYQAGLEGMAALAAAVKEPLQMVVLVALVILHSVVRHKGTMAVLETKMALMLVAVVAAAQMQQEAQELVQPEALEEQENPIAFLDRH